MLGFYSNALGSQENFLGFKLALNEGFKLALQVLPTTAPWGPQTIRRLSQDPKGETVVAHLGRIATNLSKELVLG